MAIVFGSERQYRSPILKKTNLHYNNPPSTWGMNCRFYMLPGIKEKSVLFPLDFENGALHK